MGAGKLWRRRLGRRHRAVRPGAGAWPHTAGLRLSSPPRASSRVTAPIPAGSRRRRRAAGWLGRRAQQAPEVRVVLLLIAQQRQQCRAVTAQRLPQQVAVHGEPAEVRRPSPRCRKTGKSRPDALTSRKRSRRRAASVSRDPAGLRELAGSAKPAWRRGRRGARGGAGGNACI